MWFVILYLKKTYKVQLYAWGSNVFSFGFQVMDHGIPHETRYHRINFLQE